VPVFAALATALSACGSQSAPTGAYTTTIANPGGVEGRLIAGPWTVTFGKGGSYTIHDGRGLGLAVGSGSYYRTTTFVINPQLSGSCGPGRGTGTYKLKLSGNNLTFIRIADPCKTRAKILTRTFTKVH
jgi:hypothetical protein